METEPVGPECVVCVPPSRLAASDWSISSATATDPSRRLLTAADMLMVYITRAAERFKLDAPGCRGNAGSALPSATRVETKSLTYAQAAHVKTAGVLL